MRGPPSQFREQLEILVEIQYLGSLFNALHSMAMTLPMLKKRMFAAWALLKRQYGRLQFLASVGLIFTVYKACVPPAVAYGCEIWGFQLCPKQYSMMRLDLVTSHLHLLKEISGVRSSSSRDILLAELTLNPKP